MQLHGLRLDGKFSDSAEHTWAYAKNVLLSRGFDEIENEPGDTLVDSSITGSIKGRIVTPNDIILFTINNTDVYIRHLSSAGVLTTLITTTTTFYNISGSTIYIEGVHCYNNEGDLIVAWTDGYNKPMIANITHLLASAVTISAESQLKDYYLFPEFNHNTFSITSTSIINGGRLPAAAYFFSLTYELEPNVNTNFGGISSPVFITDNDNNTSYQQFVGNGSLIVTNKSIQLNLTGLDVSRDYFKIAVIQKTESGTNCYITKRVKIDKVAATAQVIVENLDTLELYNINEVIVSSPAYKTIKTITTSNKKLRIGGLTKISKLTNAQIYDNILIPSILSVNWVADTTVSLYTSKNSYKDSVFIFNTRGFRSDEVYALYIGLKLKTGGYYGIYHIPGRPAISNEATAQTIDSTNDDYKLTSSATRTGSNNYGPMGFWENENETYGGNYGTTLGSNKVRHHRFPSAGQINTWKTGILHTNKTGNLVQELDFVYGYLFPQDGGTENYYAMIPNVVTPSLGTFLSSSSIGNNYSTYTATFAQTINISFSADYTFSSNDNGVGIGYMVITKIPLTGSNTVLINQSVACTANSETKTITATSNGVELLAGESIQILLYIYSTGIDGTDIEPHVGGTSSFTIYSPTQTQEVLGLRIALDWGSVDSGIRAALESVVDGWEIFYAKRTLNNQLMLDQSIAIADAQGFRFYGFDSMSNKLNIEPTHAKSQLLINYNAGTYVNEVTDYTADSGMKIAAITKIKYLPPYNSATIPSNESRENCYYFEANESFNGRLVNFMNLKDNVYLDFSNQELVSTGIVKPLVTTAAFNLYGGDTFIGHNSVLTFPTASLTAPLIWYFPVESILNTGLRYEGVNDYEKFYPATDITKIEVVDLADTQPYILAMVAAGVANYYFYNNDYHLLNTFRQDSINNELTSLLELYPDRIHSSMPQPLESSSVYWRKFKVLDYFDMSNNKGGIYKMLGNDNIVYIQTTYSIFRGIVVDKLVTGNIDVALKSSEMFDRPLDELLDADGTYIQPYDRDGMILTPYGLVVADLNKGSIYVISDKATEITKLGIEDWFRNTIKSTMTFGTPETVSNGVILGYDDLYKRLLVTIKNSNPNTIANFTLSFQFEKMQWIGFHRYTPDRYIWNANGLYRIDSISITKMLNSGYGYNLSITSVVRSGTGGITVTVTTTASHNLKTGDTAVVTGANVAVCNGTFLITVTGLTTFTYTTTASTTGAVTGASIIVSDPSVIDFVFNNNRGERFLLKNVKWTTNIEASGINYWDETINKLFVYSKNMCTELITIAKRSYGYNAGTYVMEETGNTSFKDGEWVYSDLKDYLTTPNSSFIDANYNIITSALNLSKNYFEKSKIIGKFISVRLIYNNSSATKKLRISNISIDAKNIL